MELRASEGQLHARSDLGPGALRAHLRDLTFTRTRLTELIRNHPAEFPGAKKDVEAVLEDLRERIDIAITDSDFNEERLEGDPPRTARIKLTCSASTPESAWRVTHALADLLINTTMARQRAALLREQAGAESAVENAEERSDGTAVGDPRSSVERLKATDARAAVARLGLRAADEQQALRIELVDPGRMPKVATRATLVGDALVTFAIVLLAAGLLGGAFDPRILDASDLAADGVALIGRLPSLPDAPRAGPGGGPRTHDGPPPASEVSAPRV